MMEPIILFESLKLDGDNKPITHLIIEVWGNSDYLRIITDIHLNDTDWFTVGEAELKIKCDHLGRLKRLSSSFYLFQCPKCGVMIG